MNNKSVNSIGTTFLLLLVLSLFGCSNMLPKQTLQFEKDSRNPKFVFWYEQNNNNEFLERLRSKFPIDSVVKNAQTDTERAFKIMNWVHNQWEHDGDNVPKNNDAISILKEAREGGRFRCVEFGIVATATLNAIGLPARTIFLKTKDVETREYGAGHVATEVFLNDLNKWAFLDVQFDIMPVLDGIPLNAVEFQRAIDNNPEQIELKTTWPVFLYDIEMQRRYIEFISKYLYYFGVNFDNREGVEDVQLIGGKRALMLVPIGSKKPTVFQIVNPLDHFKYTHSLADFYAPPNE